MSRSYRKPYLKYGYKAGSMKKWKKLANQNLKIYHPRIEFENASPGYYKRINDNWLSPRDGKLSYNPVEVKLKRK